MAFDVNSMNENNTPMRWRIVGKDLQDNDPAQLDNLDPVYKSVLEKAATFTSDDQLGVGNQPGVGSEPDPEPVLVTGITVTSDVGATLSLAGTNEANLTADVLPADADDNSVTFSSGDEGVATVTGAYGLVTAVAEGTVTITATANDGSGITGTIEITVEA